VDTTTSSAQQVRLHLLDAFEAIDVTVPLSVYPSVTFVHRAQTAENIDTISFAYGKLHVSLILLYNSAYIGQPIPPHVLLQTDPLLLISASEILDGKLLWVNG